MSHLKRVLHCSIEAFVSMLYSKVEREWREKCKSRPLLSDDEFVAAYYPNCSFDREIPLRVRRVFVIQEDAGKIIPTDCAWDITDEIDFGELIFEIADEFSIKISHSEIVELEGTFDSIVQLVARKLSEK